MKQLILLLLALATIFLPACTTTKTTSLQHGTTGPDDKEPAPIASFGGRAG